MAKQIPQELKQQFKTELAQLQKNLTELCGTVKEIRKAGINIELAEFAILRSVKKQFRNVQLTTSDVRMVLQGIENIEEYLSDMTGWEQ